ncbi:glycoside hydrolase family 61 protein, partial [Tulasnella calospora MUT 4182]
GPNPLVTPYPTDIIDIPAGSKAAIQYNNVLQPNGYDPTNAADPVDPSHKGPVMIYMAKVPSALQTDVTGLGWFKVFEDGYDGTNWGVDRMVANHGVVTFTVPACIPSGNYFLRAEMIALHPASSYPGAQFYVGCAQINVVGGGSTQPATVSLPGAYHGTDPGITINIYYPPVTNYTIPGPRPFTCSGSSGSTTKTSTTSTTSKTSTTTTTTTTTRASTTTSTTTTKTSSTATSTTSAAGGYASQYAQCGGS